MRRSLRLFAGLLLLPAGTIGACVTNDNTPPPDLDAGGFTYDAGGGGDVAISPIDTGAPIDTGVLADTTPPGDAAVADTSVPADTGTAPDAGHPVDTGAPRTPAPPRTPPTRPCPTPDRRRVSTRARRSR